MYKYIYIYIYTYIYTYIYIYIATYVNIRNVTLTACIMQFSNFTVAWSEYVTIADKVYVYICIYVYIYLYIYIYIYIYYIYIRIYIATYVNIRNVTLTACIMQFSNFIVASSKSTAVTSTSTNTGTWKHSWHSYCAVIRSFSFSTS